MNRSLPKAACIALLLALSGTAAADADSPLLRGWYVAPMYSHVKPDNDRMLDTGRGGTLALGYRASEGFALELYGVYGKLDGEPAASASTTMSGGGIGALAFLADWLPGMYLPFAVGYLQTDRQGSGGNRYKGVSFEAGLGYLLALHAGRYDFAVRAEARYRHHNGQDGRLLDEEKAGVQDALFNLGVQLPLGLRLPDPEAEAVRVVEPVAPPDSDGDGVPDDRDQCPNTPAGETVDAGGCPPPPSPPPCASPEPGAAVSLAACDVDDVIVLRGVNFESDKASLTPQASGILDSVAAELRAHPGVLVEIGGHTDALGSDAYNRRLSERRAQAVHGYLVGEGVPAGQLTVRGYGASRPVSENDTAAGRERNRRVELKIITKPEQ